MSPPGVPKVTTGRTCRPTIGCSKALVAHLAHAERVLADAAWDALSTPRPGDSLEKIDLPLTPTTVERAGRRQGITGVLLLPYSPERQR
jgi:hypothetical protein